MFNTYVVNLKKDTKKWNQIQEDFRNTGIHLNRFNAIYGKK
jgi:GR25 family glycosyltransferase involved in LPS biosynthesis